MIDGGWPSKIQMTCNWEIHFEMINHATSCWPIDYLNTLANSKLVTPLPKSITFLIVGDFKWAPICATWYLGVRKYVHILI
jgi:hypothetical protein